MKYIDLSHTIVDHMPVFPGDPETSLVSVASIKTNGYTDHKLTSVMHVGTHIDAPFHMIEGGKWMSEISLDSFMGPGVFVNAKGKSIIDQDLLKGVTFPPRAIVLLYTGMDKKYGTREYETDYPSITQEFATIIASSKARMICMDMINPDTESDFPIHKILLGSDVLIGENLTGLSALVGVSQFDVIALPLKLHADAAFARIVAVIQEE